VIDLKKTSF